MSTEFKELLSELAKNPELIAGVGAVHFVRPWANPEPTSVGRPNAIRAFELSDENGKPFKVTKVNYQDAVE